MRGHLRWAPLRHPARGSIPADAGAPKRNRTNLSGQKVYPRGCGGTELYQHHAGRGKGLSPRMRGHRTQRIFGHLLQRSIPADAGAPRGGGPEQPTGQVYPRGCGGTRQRRFSSVVEPGLSPRMRGHLPQLASSHPANRSIPADAGAPHVHVPPGRESPVYPRGCGGTRWAGLLIG